MARIAAADLRFSHPTATDVETLERCRDNHVAAMRGVHGRYKDDLDIAALFAEAMMQRTPWALWDTASGRPGEAAETDEVLQALAEGLAKAERRDIVHRGLAHLQVHALEMAPARGLS